MGAQAVGGFATIAVVLLSQRWLIPGRREADGGDMFVRVRKGEAARIRARYGDRLADVAVPADPIEEFEVPCFDALLRLADEHGTRISCVPDRALGRDLYFVEGGGIRFRYRAAARPGVVPRAVTV